jgi:hypothetical protein
LKALTICQPYAHAIACGSRLPKGVPPKFVENRPMRTHYRGPLLIHAGLSTAWLKTWDYEMPKDMVYGAIIGICELKECFQAVSRDRFGVVAFAEPEAKRFLWLPTDPHVSGPFCYVLTAVRELIQPIPCRGAQGMWNYDGPLPPGI